MLFESRAMAASWDTYIVQLDGAPALIRVDSGLAASAPLKSLPWNVRCTIVDLPIAKNMLPTDAAMKRIARFETKAVALLEEKSAGVYAGRFSFQAVTHFSFHTQDAVTLMAIFHRSQELGNIEPVRCNGRVDAAWSNYFHGLYPQPTARNRIENDRVRDVLRSKGDDGGTRRTVVHSAHFPNPTGLAAFVSLVLFDGYKIMSESAKPDKNGQWSIRFSMDQFPVTMDAWTWRLRERALKHNGTYDGWESPVVLPAK